MVGKLSFYQILLVTNPTRLSSVAVLRYISSVHPLNNRYWQNFRVHFLSLLPNSRPQFLFTHLDNSTSSSRGTNWPISMTVYLMDGPALVEQQEQWTADRRFIFLFPSSRASRSYRAPREISRSPRLVHKAPVMQATDYEVFGLRQWQLPTKQVK